MSADNKDKNEWSIEDALKKMLEDNAIKNKYIEYKIISIWEEIVGAFIKKHTTKILLKEKKLYVHINSPIIKNELLMQRSQLLSKLQEKIESNHIEELIIK